MPGLLRGIARTAVVAGTASAVAGGVSHYQSRRWARKDRESYEQQMYEQQQAYAQQQALAPPAPAAGAEPDRLTALAQLGDLKAQGVLTEEEFEAEKAKILRS